MYVIYGLDIKKCINWHRDFDPCSSANVIIGIRVKAVEMHVSIRVRTNFPNWKLDAEKFAVCIFIGSNISLKLYGLLFATFVTEAHFNSCYKITISSIPVYYTSSIAANL